MVLALNYLLNVKSLSWQISLHQLAGRNDSKRVKDIGEFLFLPGGSIMKRLNFPAG